MARNKTTFMKYHGSANNAVEKWAADLKKQLTGQQEDLVNKLEKVLDVVEGISQDLIPEDTLAAKKSFYREIVVEGDKIIARAGYDKEGSLPYILYIHEFPPINGFKKSGASTRFLAKGFEQAALNIDKILADTYEKG